MIIITGASRGIGYYLYDHFFLKNELVIGTYNNTKPPENADLSSFYKLDVSNFSSVELFFNEVKNFCENIVLINCAGISYNSFLHKSDPVKWKEVIEVNLQGTYHMIRVFLPLMRKQNYGRIINMSSVVAQKTTPGVSAYAASKSALWGLTKSVASENAKKGITINNLNLGYFDIGMISDVPNEFRNKLKQIIPTNNFGDPENIFNAVEFLIKSDYTNGTSIDINAGII